MAEEETKPLLIRANPTWNRRTSSVGTSSHSNGVNGLRRTQPQLQRSDSEVLSRADGFSGHGSGSSSSNPWHVRLALAAILLAVILERITYYGLTGNLVLFLNMYPFYWESYYAMGALFLFFGISYIMSLVGGWLADSFLGRFKAILFAYVVYICGFVLLPFIAENTSPAESIVKNRTLINDEPPKLPKICGSNNTKTDDVSSPFEEKCAWLINLSLIITAIGAGALKANICPFGSDQLARANQQTQLSFFNWFYWCVNLGSFLGLGVIAYVEQQKSFFRGFIACAVALGVSGLSFVLGRWCYVSRPADGSVLSNIFRIIREAWRRKRERKRLQRVHRQSISQGSHAEVDEASTMHEQKLHFLDYAKLRHGGIFHNSLVDDVKKLGMILAVFAVLIPYWIVYFQMQTTFLIQGLHMKLFFSPIPESKLNWTDINPNNSIIPKPNWTDINPTYTPKVVAAWFSLFDALFVIILLPLFDQVIYPRMARAGYPFTFTKRIVLGMLFAIASMIVAGVVEHYRLKAFWPNPKEPCKNVSIQQVIGNTEYNAADMTVLWQIPQYALVGISEVFASVACLQFAVSVAPRSMKAIITGLFYLFSGVGSLLGVAIITILSSTQTWFYKQDSGNINCRFHCEDSSRMKSCHLDFYFYFLAGFEALGLILFLVVARVFKLDTDALGLNARTRDETTEEKNKNIQQTAGSSSVISSS